MVSGTLEWKMQSASLVELRHKGIADGWFYSLNEWCSTLGAQMGVKWDKITHKELVLLLVKKLQILNRIIMLWIWENKFAILGDHRRGSSLNIHPSSKRHILSWRNYFVSLKKTKPCNLFTIEDALFTLLFIYIIVDCNLIFKFLFCTIEIF